MVTMKLHNKCIHFGVSTAWRNFRETEISWGFCVKSNRDTKERKTRKKETKKKYEMFDDKLLTWFPVFTWLTGKRKIRNVWIKTKKENGLEMKRTWASKAIWTYLAPISRKSPSLVTSLKWSTTLSFPWNCKTSSGPANKRNGEKHKYDGRKRKHKKMKKNTIKIKCFFIRDARKCNKKDR